MSFITNNAIDCGGLTASYAITLIYDLILFFYNLSNMEFFFWQLIYPLKVKDCYCLLEKATYVYITVIKFSIYEHDESASNE